MFDLRRRVRVLERATGDLGRWRSRPYVEKLKAYGWVRRDYLDEFFPRLEAEVARFQALLCHLGLEINYEPSKTIKGKIIVSKRKKDSPAKEDKPGND